MSRHPAKTASPAFHQPVMGETVLKMLFTDASGVYIDATLGGGGHSRMLLSHLSPAGRVIGIDRDASALLAAKKAIGLHPQLTFVEGRFSELAALMAGLGIRACAGIVADLGVSSHQIDTAARGFSFTADGPLDMRMDPGRGEPASALLARLDEAALSRLIFRYGEERRARALARAIWQHQRERPLTRTAELAALVERHASPKYRIKTLARVFQALRIAVNNELGELESFLPQAFELLKPSGRLVIIAYHSLEDRMVKGFMNEKARGCICPPEMPQCGCGKRPQARLLTKRVVTASEDEIKINSRARSAKLRVLEKIRVV